MQVYFFLPYKNNSRGASWTKKSFEHHVMTFLREREAQIEDYFTNGCRWWAYGVLVSVVDRVDALSVRKEVEHRCRLVDRKCKPSHFELHEKDVKLEDLAAFGGLRAK